METVVSILVASFMALIAIAALADRATSHSVDPQAPAVAAEPRDREADIAADQAADRDYDFVVDEPSDTARQLTAEDRLANAAADEAADRDAYLDVEMSDHRDDDRAADAAADVAANYAVQDDEAAAPPDPALDLAADKMDDKDTYAIAEEPAPPAATDQATRMANQLADWIDDSDAQYAIDEPGSAAQAAAEAAPAEAAPAPPTPAAPPPVIDIAARAAALPLPAFAKPAEMKSEASKTAEIAPAETKPTEIKSARTAAAQTKSAETASAETASAEAASAETISSPTPTAAPRPVRREVISGGSLILPARFVPFVAAKAVALIAPTAAGQESTRSGRSDDVAPEREMPPIVQWNMPLMERALGSSEKSEPLAPALQNAINRIEPMYDPTRVEGPVDVVALRVTAGTASLADVFGEHWHLASDDPTIDLNVAKIGLAWRVTASRPCEAFTKKRPRQVGDVALTALSAADCARLQQRQAIGYDDARPVPIVSAAISLPTFAAPMPGARMSSEDFWAAQRARVEAIEARLQQRMHLPQPSPEQIGLRL